MIVDLSGIPGDMESGERLTDNSSDRARNCHADTRQNVEKECVSLLTDVEFCSRIMPEIKIKQDFSYSELVEIHRIDEATATPLKEGASLSEYYSNNKRIGY